MDVLCACVALYVCLLLYSLCSVSVLVQAVVTEDVIYSKRGCGIWEPQNDAR